LSGPARQEKPHWPSRYNPILQQNLFFYRSSSGAEIDLLLMNDKKAPIAVEIKYSLSPQATKGFWTSYGDLGCRKGFIVYPGSEAYPLEKDVFVLPLKILRIL